MTFVYIKKGVKQSSSTIKVYDEHVDESTPVLPAARLTPIHSATHFSDKMESTMFCSYNRLQKASLHPHRVKRLINVNRWSSILLEIYKTSLFIISVKRQCHPRHQQNHMHFRPKMLHWRIFLCTPAGSANKCTLTC